MQFCQSFVWEVINGRGSKLLGELYVIGEFHGSEEASTKGKLGDIRGRPNEEDLRKVQEDVQKIVKQMKELTGAQ